MDNNLGEIFPSIHYYLDDDDDDHPQLLHPQIPSQQPLSRQDIMEDHPTKNPDNDSSVINESFKAAATTTKKRKRREEAVKIQQGGGDGGDSCRNALHRDVERRRRNQMADLYKSLRSLLPLQYVKGKRSASDHMQASVSYIKDLKKKIEGLHKEREIKMMKMKMKTSNNNNISSSVENDDDAKWCWAANDVCVAVNKCEDGVEILMNTCGGGGAAYPLSKLLDTLLRHGLDVVNCCYSHQEEWSLLKIQSQVNEWSAVDVAALQQKLVDIVIQPH